MVNPPPKQLITPITEKRRVQILDEILSCRPDAGPLRVFGYGSLMWSPCFDIVKEQVCRLRNYQRGFLIWSVFARGTPEKPGLGLGLELKEGASCDGILFTLSETTTREDLFPLWEREMWTDTYHPEWITVQVEDGFVSALTFVVSTDHLQYAGDLTISKKAAYIAEASGKYGTCHEYLSQTVAKMRELGFYDTEMEELLAAVDALKG